MSSKQGRTDPSPFRRKSTLGIQVTHGKSDRSAVSGAIYYSSHISYIKTSCTIRCAVRKFQHAVRTFTASSDLIVLTDDRACSSYLCRDGRRNQTR